MITQIEDFFTKGCGRCARFATPACSVHLWPHALQELRQLCQDAGLVETVKWGHPCYMHAGRNIVILSALRSEARLSFFNAGLMRDPAGILTLQGPHSQNSGSIRLADDQCVRDFAPVIRRYLAEAMGYAEAGLLAPKIPRDITLPDELVESFDADPELAEAFAALTPGRQRSYVINLAGAKAKATKFSRIAKFRPHILAGKGATER